MLKVLFTASGKRVGGATMAMLHLMLGLRGRGVQPILLSTHPLPSYQFIYRRLEEKGARLILFGEPRGGPWFWLKLFLETLKAIKREGIHLIHCHGTKEALVIGLAAKLLSRKVVYTVEGDPLLEMAYSPGRYSPLSRIVLAFSWLLGLRLADGVVGCSRWMAHHLKRYGVKADSAPNPIDYERFAQPRSRRESRAVVAIARFEKVKGLDTLLEAAAQVVKRLPEARFLLVGGGSMEDELKRLAERLGIADHVEFQGFRPDAERVLTEAAAAALPSIYEPFGMAAAEALAAGKPVIAARTGGLQEIVREDVDGFLFTPGDHRDLADKLIKLLSDAELKERMSAEARKWARRFAPEEVAKIYKRIYLNILGKQG